MRKKLIAGNWKMNGTLASVNQLTSALIEGVASIEDHCEVAVFPPSIYLTTVLSACQQAATSIKIGAQCVSARDDGAFTGQISTSMLEDLGCQYALIGHSERRQYNHETDSICAAMFAKTLNSSITPLLCVGEQLEDREQNLTEAVITRQIQTCLNSDSINKKFVIAYEPVWAIGTGKTATPQQAQEVHALIRRLLHDLSPGCAQNTQILYGGSVKPDNAGELMALPDVDGVLVGGCSLHSEQFLSIITSQS